MTERGSESAKSRRKKAPANTHPVIRVNPNTITENILPPPENIHSHSIIYCDYCHASAGGGLDW